jgi:hypothetical protein
VVCILGTLHYRVNGVLSVARSFYNIPGVAIMRLESVTFENSIQVAYMQTRLNVNGIFKDFIKTGDLRLTETEILKLDE